MTELVRKRIDQAKIELGTNADHGALKERFAKEWEVTTRTVERVLQCAREERRIERHQLEANACKMRLKQAEEKQKRLQKTDEAIDAVLLDIIFGRRMLFRLAYNKGEPQWAEMPYDGHLLLDAIRTYMQRHPGLEQGLPPQVTVELLDSLIFREDAAANAERLLAEELLDKELSELSAGRTGTADEKEVTEMGAQKDSEEHTPTPFISDKTTQNDKDDK